MSSSDQDSLEETALHAPYSLGEDNDELHSSASTISSLGVTENTQESGAHDVSDDPRHEQNSSAPSHSTKNESSALDVETSLLSDSEREQGWSRDSLSQEDKEAVTSSGPGLASNSGDASPLPAATGQGNPSPAGGTASSIRAQGSDNSTTRVQDSSATNAPQSAQSVRAEPPLGISDTSHRSSNNGEQDTANSGFHQAAETSTVNTLGYRSLTELDNFISVERSFDLSLSELEQFVDSMRTEAQSREREDLAALSEGLRKAKSPQARPPLTSSNVDIMGQANHRDSEILLTADQIARNRGNASRLVGASVHESAHIRSESAPEWPYLNRLLEQNGITTIPLAHELDVPSGHDIRKAMAHTLHQLIGSNRLIHELLRTSNEHKRAADEASKEVASLRQEHSRLHAEVNDLRGSASRAEQKLRDQKAGDKDARANLERSLAGATQKLGSALQMIRAREREIGALQDKLQQLVQQEDRRRERDRMLFRKLRHRGARSRSNTDTILLETISAFESQREVAERDVAVLRREVQRLTDELREKDNLIARKDKMRAWRGGQEGEALAQILEEQKKTKDLELEVARLNRMLAQRARDGDEELAEAQRKCDELVEQNADLRAELDARPTADEHAQALRKIMQLEQDIVFGTNASTSSAGHGRHRPLQQDTRQMMQRDRDVYALRLNRVRNLPRDVARDILTDVCRTLRLSDVTLVLPSIEKLRAVAESVPQMKDFIQSVIDTVFAHPSSILDGVHADRRPEHALRVLKTWSRELYHLAELREFREILSRELAKRPNIEDRIASDMSMATVATMVRELVEGERDVLLAQETYQNADRSMQEHPGLLVNKIVAHFRHLFDVHTMEGIFPKMNELYLFTGEARNFLAALRSTLGLASAASVNEILGAVRRNVELERRNALAHGDLTELSTMDPNHKNTLASLKRITGVSRVTDLVPEVQRVLRRLSRLETAAPRVLHLVATASSDEDVRRATAELNRALD